MTLKYLSLNDLDCFYDYVSKRLVKLNERLAVLEDDPELYAVVLDSRNEFYAIQCRLSLDLMRLRDVR